jgi:hypothetical protein
MRSIRLRPKKPYKESMKQKVSSLKRQQDQQTLSQHDKMEEEKDPNL